MSYSCLAQERPKTPLRKFKAKQMQSVPFSPFCRRTTPERDELAVILLLV